MLQLVTITLSQHHHQALATFFWHDAAGIEQPQELHLLLLGGRAHRMSDLTVYAEALIATVARAFYDDEAVVLIDVLIRDKFLRDDDMAPRLNLPAKRLRQTLQFLQEEHLVSSETVDDLAQGGSQATKFYYLDYNRAVHSIRLRVHLLRQKLERAELRARSSSFYLCPGYKIKRCNGRYTEEEAQQVLDMTTGLFLCGECSATFQNDPNPPPLETYTLQLVDNTRELKLAMDNLRRLNVQLSAKYVGNDQLRAGIYDLLQKVRGHGSGKAGSSKPMVLTSNLPSENFALGLGSKRLAGTGRTAGIRAKKLEQQGVATSVAQARNYLVDSGLGGTATSSFQDVDLLRLTNAMGQKVQFQVERGGGARAQLLATKKRRRLKLMDAAASRVGVSLPLYERVQELLRHKARQEEENGKTKKKPVVGEQFEFLKDNIGRNGAGGAVVSDSQDEIESSTTLNGGQYTDPDDVSVVSAGEPSLLLQGDAEEMTEEMRRVAFQPQYKIEMGRQSQLLKLNENEIHGTTASPPTSVEDDTINWEDGEAF